MDIQIFRNQLLFVGRIRMKENNTRMRDTTSPALLQSFKARPIASNMINVVAADIDSGRRRSQTEEYVESSSKLLDQRKRIGYIARKKGWITDSRPITAEIFGIILSPNTYIEILKKE